MIKTECPKCKEELIQHDGYGVCSKCGEIVGYDVEEEPEEIIEEILTPPQPAEKEIIPEEVNEPEVFEETTESVGETEEDIIEETVVETEEIADVEEETEEVKDEVVINEEVDIPKKKKTPFVILIIVILCILALLGGYFITKVNSGVVDNETENVAQEDIIEEEPKAIEEEPEEVQIQQEVEVEKEETVAPEPAPVKQQTPKKETVKKEDAVISPTPSISYRIRRTADDSDTQIGAFSDLERAKAFAASHSADGYKVYDMNGNVVFEP